MMPRLLHRILAVVAGALLSTSLLNAGELAFVRSGPPGAPARVVFQPTDEPITRLEAWEVLEEFQVRSVWISEGHVGFTDLQHGQINREYRVPNSPAPKRYFRKQTITSAWAADYARALPGSMSGSMNVVIERNLMRQDSVSGSWNQEEVFQYRDIVAQDMYGGNVYGPEVYTGRRRKAGSAQPTLQRVLGTVTVSFAGGTETYHSGKPGAVDQVSEWNGYAVPYWDASGLGPTFWGADMFRSPSGVGAVFGSSAPANWTDTNVLFQTSGVGVWEPVNSASFSYSLQLSDEDTKAHVQARFDRALSLGTWESIPWETERTIQHGGETVSDRRHWSSDWLYLYNETEYFASDGYIEYQKAQIRFVVPPELRIPGTGYRARIIERFYPNSDPYTPTVVAIHTVDLHEGQWESPAITLEARDNGGTEVQFFTMAAELLQPRRILSLAPPAGGGTPTAPWEYLQSKPAFTTTAQVTDTAGEEWAERKILTGSRSLQQLNLADSWGTLYDFDDLSATWSVLPGATAPVRLWHWRDDGTALGRWTLLAPGAELRDYFGSTSDFIFVEALGAGTATVRITLTLGGQAVHDDLAVQSGPPQLKLAVDNNRDGLISMGSDANADDTSTANPLRFWVNDDIDRRHSFPDSAADSMADVIDNEDDDIGPREAQEKLMSPDCWTDNRPDSLRDLEDFSRVRLAVGDLLPQLRTGELMLGLRWSGVTAGNPAIRLYRQSDQTGSLSYLTDVAVGTAQRAIYAERDARFQQEAPSVSLHALIRGPEPFVLSASTFASLTDTTELPFLFEVVEPGAGQLELVLLRSTNGGLVEVGAVRGVWMDLKPIGDMYEHWSVGNESGGLPATLAGRIPAEGRTQAFSYLPGSPEERRYILFVHGWNMEKWEKERFAETAFKRLWWQGYKGRFGLFSWPCTNRFDESHPFWKGVEGVTDGTNFDRGEWTAWRTGAAARQLFQALQTGYAGELHVFSHSMGGIVVGEALRLQSQANGSPIAKVYVASQAALSAHLYDGTLTNGLQWTYAHPSAGNGPPAPFGPDTPNIYPNWFAFVAAGGGGGTRSVGRLVNFFNANDWALAAPVWQFNQITKPDWPDVFFHDWRYSYVGEAENFDDAFAKSQGRLLIPLRLGNRADVMDRYEIMAFAAESRVKAFGATNAISPNVGESVDLRTVWGPDPEGGEHKAHKWHSAQFRSSVQLQRNYWKVILSDRAFNIPTQTLP